MEQTQKHLLRKYRMHESGGIILSLEACSELGWKHGDLTVDQYMDEHNRRLLVVNHKHGVLGVLDAEFEHFQFVLRTYPVSSKGYMTVDLGVRQRLGWRGGEYTQTLDIGFGGILISKVKELEDGKDRKN